MSKEKSIKNKTVKEDDPSIKKEDSNLQNQNNILEENLSATETEKEEENTELLNAQAQLAELNDRLLRLSAEYENYRRRTAKEKADLMMYGGEKILTELLPVIDDLELALQNIQTSDDVEALKKGIELIVEKFFSFLKRQGVEQMEVLKKPFDTSSQQAIAIVPTDDPTQKGVVIDCTKKGYTIHEKVLRYADVVVGE